MQIIVLMSGFGERFRRAIYALSKPLSDVDGKLMIGYVWFQKTRNGFADVLQPRSPAHAGRKARRSRLLR